MELHYKMASQCSWLTRSSTIFKTLVCNFAWRALMTCGENPQGLCRVSQVLRRTRQANISRTITLYTPNWLYLESISLYKKIFQWNHVAVCWVMVPCSLITWYQLFTGTHSRLPSFRLPNYGGSWINWTNLMSLYESFFLIAQHVSNAVTFILRSRRLYVGVLLCNDRCLCISVLSAVFCFIF